MSRNAITRVAGLADGLSTAERARLVLAAWCEDEEPDPELLRPQRYGDEMAQRAIVDRVVHINELAGGQLSYWQQWVYELEVYVLWLESLRAIEAVSTPLPVGGGLPVMRWGAGDGLTPLVGSRTRERWDDEPPTLDRLEEALIDHVTLDLARRWRDLGSLEAVFARLSREHGCPTLHRQLRTADAELRAKLLDIQSRIGGDSRPDLLEPSDDEVDALERLLLSQDEDA